MAQEVKNIAVIGAGQMGNGIAQISIMAGYNVMMIDIKQEFVDKGYSAIENGIKKLETKGLLNASEVMGRLKTSLDLASAVKDSDFIIEAVIEDIKIKKNVFKTCDENSPPHCIISSNTSTMSITEIASVTNREDKCIGMHFFNPPPLMRLIEVIRGDKTSDESMEIGVKLSESLPCLRGDRYVARVLRDRPGFIVNRLNAPVGIYSKHIIDYAAEQGIPWEQLDADSGGRGAMTPLVLADYVGLDTAYHISNYYAETLSPDFKPGKTLTKMVQEGKLGAKTGQGYYDWSKGRPKPDLSKKAKLFNIELVMAIRLNEGCRLLEEGVASGWKVIDDASMAGTNAPGPFMMGKNNYERWTKVLEEFVEKSGYEYLRPCELMKSGKFIEMK